MALSGCSTWSDGYDGDREWRQQYEQWKATQPGARPPIRQTGGII
jgi:hypothetical protein